MKYQLASAILDFLTVKRTDLAKADESMTEVYFENPDKDSEDPVKTDDECGPGEWWQSYGVASRPPTGAQALLLRAGDVMVGIAARVSAAKEIIGLLSPGDVALYSVGKNLIRLNANGSIAVRAKDKKGRDMVAYVDPKGPSVKLVVSDMALEVSEENGIVLNAGNRPITLAGMSIQLNGQSLNCNVPVSKLHMGASMPLQATSTAPGVFV